MTPKRELLERYKITEKQISEAAFLLHEPTAPGSIHDDTRIVLRVILKCLHDAKTCRDSAKNNPSRTAECEWEATAEQKDSDARALLSMII